MVNSQLKVNVEICRILQQLGDSVDGDNDDNPGWRSRNDLTPLDLI